MSKFSFNKIVVCESIPEGEKKTAKAVYEDLIPLSCFHERSVDIEYYDFSVKSEFIEIIEKQCSLAREGNFPVLQLDVHGHHDGSGIVLSSDEYIEWKEVCNILTKLNYLTRCNLLVVMAACHGVNLVSAISVSGLAPFWGIVAPEYVIYPDQIAHSLTGFYRSIFERNNTESIVGSLKFDELSPNMSLISCEYLFIEAYRIVFRDYCTEPELTRRARALRDRYILSGHKHVWPISKIKEGIVPSAQHVERDLKRFLMANIYPENANKISISREQLKTLTSGST